MIPKCPICCNNILSHSCFLKCECCKREYHIQCLPDISKTDILYVERDSNIWLCPPCLSDCFPFNNIYDDHEFKSVIRELSSNVPNVSISDLNKMIFDPFELNEDSSNNPLLSSDPDLQYFNTLTNGMISCDYYLEDTFNEKCKKFLMKNDDVFSICHTNIRSMPKNFTSFQSYLASLCLEFSAIAISETWLTNDNIELYNLPGYNMIGKCREKKRGGGVSIIIKESIKYKVREDLSMFNTYIESLFIETNNNVLGVIYRPPNTDILIFNEYLQNIMEVIKGSRKTCFISGDFNINLLNVDTHEPSSAFIDLMFSAGFLPLINKPTRISKYSSTIIDNIFCNDATNNHFNGILVSDTSDHFPIFHINAIPTKCKNNDIEYFLSRSMSEKNMKHFSESLRNADWNSVLGKDDAQIAFTKFHEIITNKFQSAFPIKKVKHGYKTKLPWLTHGLKKSISIKNKLYKKYIANPNESNSTNYKTYKNKLSNILRKAERNYYNSLIVENQCNSRKKWSIIKEVINKKRKSGYPTYFNINDKLINNKKMIANTFNNYFNNVGHNLAKDIPAVPVLPSSYIKETVNETIYLKSVTTLEVDKIIKALKTSSSGWDNISAKVVKETSAFFIHPLTHILNLSILSGIFPTELKVTKVIPIFKSNDNMNFCNYRPIAVLSVFSKIFEKIMYRRLVDFINKHKLLYELQFGFRENHSTSMALTLLIDKISSAMDAGNFSVGVFLDFSKAFDTVNHDILFQKLEKYGIRGLALTWLKSYLYKREQFVVFEGVESDRCLTSCGVPQGSILGPLLFLLYINDISSVSTVMYMILFADDTNAFFTGSNLDEIFKMINDELPKIVTWLQANKLSLNVNKSHFIVFTRKKIIGDRCVQINGENIDCVQNTKFLGVQIDSKLSWNKHISTIRSKIARGVGILCKTRKVFNQDTLLNLYYSFVYPHISYCIELWGSASKDCINSILKIQKKCVRIICNSNWKAHSDPLFTKLEILRVDIVYFFKLLTFVYKFINLKLPAVFNDFFQYSNSVHQYPTRHNNLFRMSLARTDLRTRTVRFVAAKLYNQYLNSVDWKTNFKKFKKCIKNVLLI